MDSETGSLFRYYAVPLLLGYALAAWVLALVTLGIVPWGRSDWAWLLLTPGMPLGGLRGRWPLDVFGFTAITGAYYGAILAAIRGLWRLRRQKSPDRDAA